VDLTAIVTPTQNAAQADLTTTSNGSIVLIAGDTITVNEGSNFNNKAISAGLTGNILLQVLTNDIHLNTSAAVISDFGHITLIAPNDINQGLNANIRTTNGSIDLQTTSGAITMNDQSMITTGDDKGNIRLFARGDIQLGGLDAGTGNVSLISSNSRILDHGDHYKDIIARNLRMNAKIVIGQNLNPLDIDIDHITAVSTDGIFLNETDGLTVTNVGPVTVNRVESNELSTIVSDAEQSDLSTSSGAIIVEVALGDIYLTEGSDFDSKSIEAKSSGNVFLHAITGNILIDSAIDGGVGNISIVANVNISQSGTGDIYTTGSGTIELEAGNRISMSDDATTTTENQNIRYLATAESITLGGLYAGSAGVSLIAGKTIFDGGDSDQEITAVDLRITAGTGVGINTDLLEINIDNFTASATSGGIFIEELDDVIVTSVGPLNVNRVQGGFSSSIPDFEIKSSNLSNNQDQIPPLRALRGGRAALYPQNLKHN